MNSVTTTTTPGGRTRRWLIGGMLLVALGILIASTLKPARVYYALSQGHKALSKGQFPTALAEYQTAHDLDPKNSEVAFFLARVSRKLGDLDGVRKYLEESQSLGYSDQKRLEREWWLAIAASGRMADAEPRLAEMLMNPGEDGSEICDAFSKGYCLSLRFSEARRLLDAWSQEYPRDHRPYLRRAQIYAGDEKWGLAIKELREALQRAPHESSVQRELGRCLYKNEEMSEAAQQLQAVISREPSDVASLMTLAQIHFDQKEHRQALDELEKVIAMQPQDFPARLLMAKTHLAMGDAARAVAIAESLVSEWPEDFNAQYVLAQSLRSANRSEEAQRHFMIHGELNKNLARIEMLAREVKKHPSDPELRYELGVLLLRHVSRTEGAAWLESVFQYASTHTDAHRALADYYEKTGNPSLATQHRQIADLNSSSESSSTTSRPGDQPQ
jgi:predicted Zn-dependent protease